MTAYLMFTRTKTPGCGGAEDLLGQYSGNLRRSLGQGPRQLRPP